MAKGDLHAVIRLTKLEIDELRRQLGALQREEAALLEADGRLDADLAHESAHVDTHPEAAFTFPGYLSAYRQRKDAVAKALAERRARIAALRDALAELYRSRKTYELAQEARDERAAQARARKDQAVLDEIGLTMHRRRRAEDGDDAPGGSGGSGGG